MKSNYIFIVLILFSCDPKRKSVEILNHTNLTLFVDDTSCYAQEKCKLYSDIESSGIHDNINPYLIQPRKSLVLGSYGWASCDSIEIDIYDVKIIDSLGWEYVCLNNLFYKTYKFSQEDIKGKKLNIE